MSARSTVPDLMFADQRECRTRRVLGLLAGQDLAACNPDLDRATVFVTHRCNLACRYCNGPHLRRSNATDPMLHRDLSLQAFGQLLAESQRHGLAHIHFTGGEPTLNPDLPAFVAAAGRVGMLTSITTNGTAAPEVYRELVAAGLAEIRISIDSPQAGEFDRIVGVTGTFDRVDRLIRELVALRDAGRPAPFIILNACIDRFDVDEAQATLTGLLACRPDDLKLLVVAQDAASVQGHASRQAVARMLQTKRSLRPEGCELLERKIRGLFRRNSAGLADADGRHLVRRCYVPLTERTIDAAFCYPCSIYLRYHGQPLCAADAPYEEQRAATAEFVATHDCRDDPICSVNCTSCCREFNVAVNRGLLEQEQQRLLECAPPIVAPQPSDAAVADALSTMHAIAAQADAPGRPFMVIRPLGMPHRDDILAYLAQQGFGAIRTTPIDDWSGCSLYLYHKSRENGGEQAMRKRLAVNAAFGRMEQGPALAVGFEPDVPVAKVQRLRADIRRWYPDRLQRFEYNGALRVLKASVVHAADANDLWWENRVIRYFAPGWERGV